MLKILILSIIILFIAVIGLSIKILFNKKSGLTGESCCKSASPDDKEGGIACGCRGGYHLLKEK